MPPIAAPKTGDHDVLGPDDGVGLSSAVSRCQVRAQRSAAIPVRYGATGLDRLEPAKRKIDFERFDDRETRRPRFSALQPVPRWTTLRSELDLAGGDGRRRDSMPTISTGERPRGDGTAVAIPGFPSMRALSV
ncbi:MAG: hypothetical protein U0X73_08085 [Thermoanaerobaculia bacterium]